MKKLAVMVLGMALCVSNAYAGVVTQSKVYATGDQVTAQNLNNNYQAIITEMNGGLDNTNVDTTNGYRLFEVLGSLPAAGTQGRVVYATANNTLNFDTGSAWGQPVSVVGTPTAGDILYYNTSWTKLPKGSVGQVLTQNTTIPEWGYPNVVQTVYDEDGNLSTTTKRFNISTGIPTNIEGEEFLNATITPKLSNSTFKIDVVVNGRHPSDCKVAAALFQNTSANAIGGVASYIVTGGGMYNLKFTKFVNNTVGTNATSFAVRAGGDDATAGTFSFNGDTGAVVFGGVEMSSLTITELKQ